jgi:hypothetical protein
MDKNENEGRTNGPTESNSQRAPQGEPGPQETGGTGQGPSATPPPPPGGQTPPPPPPGGQGGYYSQQPPGGWQQGYYYQQAPPPGWFFQNGQWYNQPYAPDGTCLISEDRTMAMLAHLLCIASGFIGPLIIYFVKKDESRFVAFHALQAVYFQIMVIVAMVISIALSFVFIGFCTMALAGIGALVYEIILAVKANEGKWEKYWLVGDWAMSSVMHLPSRR